jgi:predicted dienelactone hydrolase
MSLALDTGLRAALLTAVLALAACGGSDDEPAAPPAPAVPASTVAPFALPGPNAVGCSNVAQDFTRVSSPDEALATWEASPASSGNARSVADLLVDPANVLTASITAPNDRTLFGRFAGERVNSTLLVCYPTAANNPRTNYALPTGETVPHMHTGAEGPLFADERVRYPVLAFSHGLRGSPLAPEYLQAIKVFASHGYVVIAPFHGDPRFINLSLSDFGDVLRLLGDLPNFLAAQTQRPLSVSAALDLVLAHPQWRDHLDATQIGGFGASLGGETMLLLAGAGLSASTDLTPQRITLDARLKAAVGYVPYFGQPSLPAFGRDQRGLESVTLPFLAIAGTADTTAPIAVTADGMRRLPGRRALVALEAVTHRFDVPSAGDIYTWSLIFLDAEVRGNAAARATLASLRSVSGGGDDRVVIPYNSGGGGQGS